VTHVLSEDDQDLHVVLEDGPAHMVAESPNAPFCTVNATAYRKRQMASAREKVRLCSHARIVGVAFWDRPHRVTGRAPNSIGAAASGLRARRGPSPGGRGLECVV
jgi:hypothetical protein